MHQNREKRAGVLLCFGIAIPAWWLGQVFPLVGAPIVAIFFGMLVAFWHPNRENTAAGIAFTAKYLLQFAVVLLGFGLNMTQVLTVGKQSLPIILATISSALLTAYIVGKILKVDSQTATLVGVGSSICGGSAIAATAPVIQAEDEEIAKSISVIFLFNILAALIFPTLGEMIGLSNDGFSLFAGTAVNDTSSVTATATAWDTLHHSNALAGATIVKLTRTLAIIPIIVGLSLYRSRQERKQSSSTERLKIGQLFPTFILYFLLASLITTIAVYFGVASSVFEPLKLLSKFCIVMAMAAIGLNTHLVRLVKTGGRALILGGICWLVISLVSLLIQHLLGIW